MSDLNILHAWADYGRESIVLSEYGTVVRATIDPKNTHREEIVRADGKRLPFDNNTFDVGLFHPFCQQFSTATPEHRRELHENVIPQVRSEAKRVCGDYIIENVPQAPLCDPVVLKGAYFALPITYRRAFETSFSVPNPPEEKPRDEPRHNHLVIGGGNGDSTFEWEKGKGYKSSRLTRERSNYHNACYEVIPRPYVEWLMDQYVQCHND